VHKHILKDDLQALGVRYPSNTHRGPAEER